MQEAPERKTALLCPLQELLYARTSGENAGRSGRGLEHPSPCLAMDKGGPEEARAVLVEKPYCENLKAEID